MTQALYAHMNNKIKKIQFLLNAYHFCILKRSKKSEVEILQFGDCLYFVLSTIVRIPQVHTPPPKDMKAHLLRVVSFRLQSIIHLFLRLEKFEFLKHTQEAPGIHRTLLWSCEKVSFC
jgi:hypothetical protein